MLLSPGTHCKVTESALPATFSTGPEQRVKGMEGGERQVKERVVKAGGGETPPSSALSAKRFGAWVWILELFTSFHPTADSLRMEVGVKKAAPRTVVAGLVNGVPTDQMQNQMVDYSVTQNLPRCGTNVLTG